MSLPQRANGPAGGVKLHRQGDYLEYSGNGKEHHAYREQGPGVHHKAQNNEQDGDLRAEIANRDDGAPYLDGAVLLGVLNGVACLMGGNPHRSDAGGTIDSIGQPDGVGPGVVVISEFARNPGYPDTIDPMGP